MSPWYILKEYFNLETYEDNEKIFLPQQFNE